MYGQVYAMNIWRHKKNNSKSPIVFTFQTPVSASCEGSQGSEASSIGSRSSGQSSNASPTSEPGAQRKWRKYHIFSDIWKLKIWKLMYQLLQAVAVDAPPTQRPRLEYGGSLWRPRSDKTRPDTTVSPQMWVARTNYIRGFLKFI